MSKPILIFLSVAGALILAVVGIFAATRHPAQTQTVPSVGNPAARTCDHAPSMPFTGIATSGSLTTQAEDFGQATGVRPQVIESYVRFGAPFWVSSAQQVVRFGALPLIQIQPRHASLTSIADGKWDHYLRTYARAIRKFRCKIALSFAHEMNAPWYPWRKPNYTPAQFIAAWRHIHDVFASVHAANVIWTWDPSHYFVDSRPWWPGSAYVDWVGLDGYLRVGKTFHSIFDWQLGKVRKFTNKPVFISETSVAPGLRAVPRTRSLFTAIRRYHLAGLIWFNRDRLEKWRIQGRSTVITAYRTGIAAMKQPQ